uniref:Uncharacterized protein n=1 Tax=Oryza punctata TaxID=4537 RepID=A0A0E0LUB4_ORYPU
MVVSDNSTAPDLQPSPTPIEAISGSRSTANKVTLFHQQPLQTYGTSTNRASNARKTTARPNYKETQRTSLRPNLDVQYKPQIGDNLSEKVLPTTAAKRIVVLPWKVSKQNNASDETSASKK